LEIDNYLPYRVAKWDLVLPVIEMVPSAEATKVVRCIGPGGKGGWYDLSKGSRSLNSPPALQQRSSGGARGA